MGEAAGSPRAGFTSPARGAPPARTVRLPPGRYGGAPDGRHEQTLHPERALAARLSGSRTLGSPPRAHSRSRCAESSPPHARPRRTRRPLTAATGTIARPSLLLTRRHPSARGRNSPAASAGSPLPDLKSGRHKALRGVLIHQQAVHHVEILRRVDPQVAVGCTVVFCSSDSRAERPLPVPIRLVFQVCPSPTDERPDRHFMLPGASPPHKTESNEGKRIHASPHRDR
jgi:hypothetical protein